MPEGQQVDTMIEEALKPLIDKEVEVEEEIAGMEEQLAEKRETRKKIRKLLITGGLREAPSAGHPKTAVPGRPKKAPSSALMEKLRAELPKGIVAEEFTAKQVNDALGMNSEWPIKVALEALRDEGLITLVGARAPDGSRGTGKATHFSLTPRR